MGKLKLGKLMQWTGVGILLIGIERLMPGKVLRFIGMEVLITGKVDRHGNVDDINGNGDDNQAMLV